MIPQSIDFHAHVMAPAVRKMVEQAQSEGRAGERERGASQDSMEHNRRLAQERYNADFGQLDRRFARMDAQQIEMEVLSPSPEQYHYWAEPELAERMVRASNEYIAELCQSHADRFAGISAVAMQHPDLAARQVTECVRDFGLKGIELSGNPAGVDLDDPRFDVVWRAVENTECVVFIHPSGCIIGSRLMDFYLNNLIGNPLDTTIALSHLIFGGVLDRFPKLKFVAAHGGGFLPSYLSRSDHGFEVRPESHRIEHPPSWYLRHRLWLDNLVYRPESVAHLAREVGPSQLVLGTDYPYDMGQDNPVAIVDAIDDLSAQEKAQIKHGNAAKLLKLAV